MVCVRVLRLNRDCLVQFSVSTAGAFRKGVESNSEVVVVVVAACDCVGK